MPYIKLRTYWYDFRGIDNNFKMYSKAQYIVLDSVNMFSDVYEDLSSLIMQSYCIDIHTKEHDTKVLYYFNKAEAEDALLLLINAICSIKKPVATKSHFPNTKLHNKPRWRRPI